MKCDENEILARTIYGEARGEYNHPTGGLPSLIAVANVVVNRVKAQAWYGKTITEACLYPRQFSCWDKQDKNYPLLNSAHTLSDPLFSLCKEVAEKVVSQAWPDLTKGSTHYYATWIKPPSWALGAQATIQIGQHKFYRL